MRNLLALLLMAPCALLAQFDFNLLWQQDYESGFNSGLGVTLSPWNDGYIVASTLGIQAYGFDSDGNYSGPLISDGFTYGAGSTRLHSLEMDPVDPSLLYGVLETNGYGNRIVAIHEDGTLVQDFDASLGQSAGLDVFRLGNGDYFYLGWKNCGGLGGGWDTRYSLYDGNGQVLNHTEDCEICSCVGSSCDFGDETLQRIIPRGDDFILIGDRNEGGTGCYAPSPGQYMVRVDSNMNATTELDGWDTGAHGDLTAGFFHEGVTVIGGFSADINNTYNRPLVRALDENLNISWEWTHENSDNQRVYDLLFYDNTIVVYSVNYETNTILIDQLEFSSGDLIGTNEITLTPQIEPNSDIFSQHGRHLRITPDDRFILHCPLSGWVSGGFSLVSFQLTSPNYGCTYSQACNYDPLATIEDGACYYPEPGFDCDGNCLNDVDGDGICDEQEPYYCSDPLACNYQGIDNIDEEFDVQTLGTADTLGSNCFILTSASSDQGGAVWSNSQLDLSRSFAIQGEVYMGSSNAGGDGIVFVLQSQGPYVIGNAGSGLGYEGISNSIGIEIDTWRNGHLGDLVEDHVAIVRDGLHNHNVPYFNIAGPVSALVDGGNIEDDQQHTFLLTWDADVEELDFYVGGNHRLGVSMDLVSDIFGGASSVWWGVTGSTGSAVNEQSVCLTQIHSECEYAETNYDCDGTCLIDSDEDGICDEYEVSGCTNSSACNYDITATNDDGSCDTLSCIGCTDPLACNYDPTAILPEYDYDYCLIIDTVAVHPSSGAYLAGMTTYRLYVQCANPSDFVQTVFGSINNPTVVTTTTDFYQHELGGTTPNGIYSPLFDVFPYLQYDSWVTIGLTEAPNMAIGEAPINTVQSIANPWASNFDPGFGSPGGNIVIDDAVGGAWFALNGDYNGIAANHSFQQVLIAQLTTSGVIEGNLYVEILQDGTFPLILDFSISEACQPFEDYCLYADDLHGQNYLNCEGNCIHDFDGDGVCDEEEIEGCQNSLACNYDGAATDPGLCAFLDEVCDTCVDGFIIDNDADDDGVCDNDEVPGCTNPEACNYSPWATDEIGSCTFGCDFCGEGTTWDEFLEECVALCPEPDSVLIPIPSCGDGTVWDPVNEECIVAIPADINFDGCVTVNDLLVLLAVHGTCPPYPEWPDEPNDAAWTCGDSLTYRDYDYATVLIGDQCWFAENLRTTQYVNGDSIAAGLTDGEWASPTSGATAVYGEGCCNCFNYSPDIDACDDAQSLAEYGRLYNWYAVDDARSLCPVGWHVPTDEEWMVLEMELGMSESEANSTGWRGTDEGTQLKSTYGWYNGGNGTDDFGFSALPGGLRYLHGRFDIAGYNGGWWSSSSIGGGAWHRFLDYYDPDVNRASNDRRDGFSVRCLRDAD